MFVKSKFWIYRAKSAQNYVNNRLFATQVEAAKIDTSVSSEYENAASFSSIPGPSALRFVLSHLPGGKLYNLDFKETLQIYRKEYGDLMRYPSVFGRPSIVFSHKPEHFQMAFRTEGQWPARLHMGTIGYFREKIRPDIYGKYQGLVNSIGKEWGEFRSAVNPVMIQPKTTKFYVPAIDEVSNDFLERIRKIRSPKNNQLPANFEEELNHWTLETTCLIALDARLGLISDKYDAKVKKFIEAIKDFFQLMFELELQPSIWQIVKTPAFKKLMAALDTITDTASQYVDEAKQRLEKMPDKSQSDHEQSVLEKLLKIDPIIAKVMAMDMIFAGVDTTSSAFVAALYMLAKNPEKQEILRKEIMSVLPKKDSSFSVETMSRLPYLRACMKETHRISPVVEGNIRVLAQNLVLDGYRIPKGTAVFMCNGAIQKDNRYYSEATQFSPERWLKQEGPNGICPATAKSAHPFIYLPFGFGPRMCIGRRFAEMEVEILLSKVIRNFHVSWEHADLKFKSKAINVPDGKLMFTLTDVDQ